MPFKANADRRHRIPKQRQKVTNWAESSAMNSHGEVSRDLIALSADEGRCPV
jgi:hypothetical protein